MRRIGVIGIFLGGALVGIFFGAIAGSIKPIVTKIAPAHIKTTPVAEGQIYLRQARPMGCDIAVKLERDVATAQPAMSRGQFLAAARHPFELAQTAAESYLRCRELLERLRWPDGWRCLRCAGTEEVITRLSDKLLFCRKCEYQFSVTAGTIFHDTHLPLIKWFAAVYLLCEFRFNRQNNERIFEETLRFMVSTDPLTYATLVK
jgi:hypothetical protein